MKFHMKVYIHCPELSFLDIWTGSHCFSFFLFFPFCLSLFFFLNFGYTARLSGSQFPVQGMNLGHNEL